MSEIYDHPEYFEIAYNFRDIRAEAATIARIIHRYGRAPTSTVLEIGCGSAPHLPELARLGYRYIGLDRSEPMLAAARRRATAADAPATFVHGDLADFELPEPVDFAMVLLGSLYVESTTQLHTHLASVARALRPGGLYLLDWTISCAGAVEKLDTWESHEGDITVHVTYRAHLIAPIEQVIEEAVTMDVVDGATRHRLKQVARQRVIYPQEFRLLIQQHPAFEFVGWWDNWNLNQPLDEAPTIYRPIVVVRRLGSGPESSDPRGAQHEP